MNNYGFKVSQAGYDVLTAAKERLVFSSAYDTPKVLMSGNGTITIDPASDAFTPRAGTITIPHSLGYKPMFFCFSDNPVWGTAGQLSPYTYRATGSTYNRATYGIDTTNLYITFYNPDNVSSRTYEYRYYIFYNQLI